MAGTESFWKNRWEHNDIGWHKKTPNPLLVDNWHVMGIPHGATIFVPLAGKSLDIHWFLANGYVVVANDLSRIAIEQLFDELHLTPSIAETPSGLLFSAPNIRAFVGNIFNLTSAEIGHVDAIYDRAALIALPPDVRKKYGPFLGPLTGFAPEFLVCLQYDQSSRSGPPFAVWDDEVNEHFGQHYDIHKVVEEPIVPGTGPPDAKNSVFALKRRA